MRIAQNRDLGVSKQFGSERIWSDVVLSSDGRFYPVVRHSRRNGIYGGSRIAGISSENYQVVLERSWLAARLAISEREQREMLKT